MKRIILLLLISFCTIGGEESQGVATIESRTETTVAEEETTFEEGVPVSYTHLTLPTKRIV